MLERYLLPLGEHFDDGLWIAAETFEAAAEKLVPEAGKRISFPHGHLPINFLYRHAIELFLKSALIVIHRTRVEARTEPLVLHEGKSRPLHRIHSIASLYAGVKQLAREHAAGFAEIGASDWPAAFTADLDGWIATIDELDPGSTFFRYPRTKSPEFDATKSGFQEIDVTTLPGRLAERGEQVPGEFILALKNDDDEIVRAFALTSEPLGEVREALVAAAKMLSAIVFGLHAELVDGLRLPKAQPESDDTAPSDGAA